MSIIELKITLNYIHPAVTRTLKVPVNIRLDRLHLTIQAAMGWHNCHLYEFMAANINWGVPDPDFGSDILPADKTTLLDVIEDTGIRSLNYIYDFGDGWDHQIKLGKIINPVPGELYPKLIALSGKCPPEDVGGPPGYEHFLEAIADPKHPEHKNIMAWYGSDFDPNTPDTDELKLEVLQLAKKWKTRKSKK
ncbi:plasmid pRiA4b ORF-3 family protein [Paremcibacter congregatus]|uniref:Plasmid pRiA4b Orf3-like domain-containing protein n=1 Tax=Paremcibacter congregatus TaxID=2043170 RepID=A0A2G4YZ65_9PROT|nr:plasmid pRiA4b ORF-3 family protein [Paremcibacter congregatus]PHZ86746.1 hypothetical protein CRD36_00165 [Paremcibacter congregatus]QDE26254.1 plasmid pRiA4b ORF-3 family protein [Paremcibacter congregatus]